jgi:hypothetical protein
MELPTVKWGRANHLSSLAEFYFFSKGATVKKYPRVYFLLKCCLSTGFFMFTSMIAGEIFVEPNLFGGFSQRPALWLEVLLESTVWTFPIALIGLLILGRFQGFTRKKYILASTGLWVALNVLIIIIYKFFYWPRAWHLTDLHPGLIFGWVIPCILILCSYSFFSLQLYDSGRNVG